MKTKQQLIAETLYSTDKEPNRVLDIGYAQNPNIHLSQGDIYGIDLMDVGVPENYKEVKIVDLNSGHIPYGDGFFDAVTMGCVLAHVANPVQLMEELHRVLKPNGVLIFSSPNPHYYWENALNIFFHKFKKRVAKAKFVEHFYSFSRYNVRTIGERTGFTIEKEVGVSFHLVKTKLSWNPERFPGMAYEIIYVLRKTGEIERYTTYEDPQGKIVKMPTDFRANT